MNKLITKQKRPKGRFFLAQRAEERCDFPCRSLRILPVRIMPDTLERREVEIGESLAEIVGPAHGKQRIAVAPADAGGQRDGRELGRFPAHGRDPL